MWVLFNFLSDAATIYFELVERFLESLNGFVDAEWAKSTDDHTELENAYGCLRKRDLVGALLSARYAVYWLGFHILRKRDIKLKTEICNAENNVEMVKKLARVTPDFSIFAKTSISSKNGNAPIKRRPKPNAIISTASVSIFCVICKICLFMWCNRKTVTLDSLCVSYPREIFDIWAGVLWYHLELDCPFCLTFRF